MAGTKVLRGNTSIWAARPEAFTDWGVPLSAADWATGVAAGLITDISCAVEDGYTLGLTGSSTDSSQSVCDIAEVETPLYYEYEASLDLFRNLPGSIDTPIYDIAMSLFDGKDVAYYLLSRVDALQGSTVVAGNILSAFAVKTDLAQDTVEDGSMAMFAARFKPSGGVNVNFTVVA